MSLGIRSVIEALALAVLALWFVWLGSGAAIAFGLSWLKPRYWTVAGASIPSLVLIETIWRQGDAPPTAAALALGFAVFWALTSIVGAWFGQTLRTG